MTTMDEKLKMAFEFAQNSTKQLISLASAIIALTITFKKDFLGEHAAYSRSLALWSWGCFLASVVFGVWTLLALTGTLDPISPMVKTSIREKNVTIPSALQIIAFCTGLLLTVLFGITTEGHDRATRCARSFSSSTKRCPPSTERRGAHCASSSGGFHPGFPARQENLARTIRRPSR